VSLFKREQIFASIELDRISLLRLAPDNSICGETSIPAALDPVRPEEHLKDLAAALASGPWRGAPCSLVLSDRLVHYLVVERPQGVRSSKELRLACEARFQASFEGPRGDWSIAVDLVPLARHYLVCGIGRHFIETLCETFAVSGKLLSVRPFLACELRRLARRLPADCWFVAVARDCMTLAGIVAGECRVARVVPSHQPSVASIQDALNREMLLSGEVAVDAPVYCAGALSGDLGQSTMRRLDAPGWGERPSAWAQGYRMALAERWSS
jgi:hypothetical protein